MSTPALSELIRSKLDDADTIIANLPERPVASDFLDIPIWEAALTLMRADLGHARFKHFDGPLATIWRTRRGYVRVIREAIQPWILEE